MHARMIMSLLQKAKFLVIILWKILLNFSFFPSPSKLIWKMFTPKYNTKPRLSKSCGSVSTNYGRLNIYK